MHRNLENIIEHLQQVQQKPLFYLKNVNSDLLENFLEGFRLACYILIDEFDSHALFLKAYKDVTKQYGWELGASSLLPKLRSRGLSENEIFNEIIKIEIETWQNLRLKHQA